MSPLCGRDMLVDHGTDLIVAEAFLHVRAQAQGEAHVEGVVGDERNKCFAIVDGSLQQKHCLFVRSARGKSMWHCIAIYQPVRQVHVLQARVFMQMTGRDRGMHGQRAAHLLHSANQATLGFALLEGKSLKSDTVNRT